MFAWMLYALTVSTLLTLAAACAAHGARLRGTPTRFIWAASLCLSLLIPAAISSVSVTLPRLSATAPAEPPHTLALRNAGPDLVAPALLLGALPQAGRLSGTLNPALPRLWAALSLLLAMAACANAALLAWRKRRWARAAITGVPVLVADHAGPALAGLLFPAIVVPRWLLDEPAEIQGHVIVHERAHLLAGDTRLLACAIALLIVMPWNLPLWWQVHRLRFAIETDCDARVIGAGASPARYAETLIRIVEHRSRRAVPAMAMAMAEPALQLEKRIRRMLDNRNRRSWLTVFPAFAAAALALGAAGVTPPNAELPSDLARFTGFYQMGPDAILNVTQQNGALFVRLTGQPALRTEREGAATFNVPAVGAEFQFAAADAGAATGVTLHQNGQIIAMARIDEARAQRIESGTQARVTRQTPVPGSKEALAHVVDGIIANSPDYSSMTPALADVVRAQLAAMHDSVGSLGPVQSITFVRVGEQGQDIYLVKQRNGAFTWRIVLAGDKVAGLMVRPAG
jgi:hypothetical protein